MQNYKIQTIPNTYLPRIMQFNNPNSLSTLPSADLTSFLHFRTLGTLQTDASLLSNEEEEQLFDMLDALHRAEGVDVRGVWPILSLCFRNRSGLVLMAMYYESRVVKSQFLVRKGFVRDLQVLENKHYSIANLQTILQVLSITPTTFLEHFQKHKQTIHKARQAFQSNPPLSNPDRPPIVLGDKIFDQYEYDSEPDNQLYERIGDGDGEDGLWRNMSVIVGKGWVGFGDEEEVEEEEEVMEETVSLVGRKRRVHPEISERRTERRKRRKAKRPTAKKRKQKMLTQSKKASILATNFASDRRQRRRLRQTYKLLMQEQQLSIQIESPKKSQQKQQMQAHLTRSTRKKKNNVVESESEEPRVYRNGRHGGVERRIFLDSEDGEEEEEEEYKAIEMESEHENEDRDQEYRRLNKTKSSSMQIEQPQPMAPEPLYNESIENLQIKPLSFPCPSPSPSLSLTDQHFNTIFFTQYLQATSSGSPRQKFTLIRQLVHDKNNISYEDLVALTVMARMDLFWEYREGYLRPMLGFKVARVLGRVVNQVVNALYTSVGGSGGGYLSVLYRECQCLILLNEYQKQMQMEDQMKKQHLSLQNYINETLTQICQNLSPTPSTPTPSLVNLPSPLSTIRSTLRIKLQPEQFQTTVLIALLILHYGFLSKMFPKRGDGFQGMPLYGVLKRKIKGDYRVLGYFMGVCQMYKVAVASKDELYEMLALAAEINPDPSSPAYPQISQLLPSFLSTTLQSFLTHKLPTTSHKAILSYLIRNPYLKQCQEGSQPLGYRITVKKYQILLGFEQFCEEITVRSVGEFVGRVGFGGGGNCEEGMYGEVVGLLIRCYRISKQGETAGKIRANLQQIFRTICNKYSTYLLTSTQLLPKLQKYSRILQTFLTQFINNPDLSSQQHYLFSLRLMVCYVWPILSGYRCKDRREDQFVGELGGLCLGVFCGMDGVVGGFAGQYDRKYGQVQPMDEEEEFEYLLTKKAELAKQTTTFLTTLITTLSDLPLSLSLSPTILSFPSPKQPLPNVLIPYTQQCNQLNGAMTGLALLGGSGANGAAMGVLRGLGQHAREVRVERVLRVCRTSNRVVLEFLGGLFKVMGGVLLGVRPREFETAMREIGGHVLDILLIGLVSERDTKTVTQLIQQTYKILTLTNTTPDHLLLKYPLPHNCPDLHSYLHSLTQNKAKYSPQTFHKMLQKFGNPLAKILFDLYREYEGGVKWRVMRMWIGGSIVGVYGLLVEVGAGEGLVKLYYPGGILEGLEIDPMSAHSCHHQIISLFRKILPIRRQTSQKLLSDYSKHLTNQQLKQLPSQKEEQFPKIRLLIETIHNTTVEGDGQRVDELSVRMAEGILGCLLVGGFVGGVGEIGVGFLFGLFRRYPKLAEAYLNAIKPHLDKIDKILHSPKKQVLQNTPNLQSALKQHILSPSPGNPYLNYSQLLQIIQLRLSRDPMLINYQPLREVIEMCIKGVEGRLGLGLGQGEMVERFRDMLGILDGIGSGLGGGMFGVIVNRN